MAKPNWKRRRKKERRRQSGEQPQKPPPRPVAPERCQVYCLKDDEGRVRYVGQTKRHPKVRLRAHLKDAASGDPRPVTEWLRRFPNPEMVILESDALWNVHEVIWIDRMRQRGEPLLNCNLGGRDVSACLWKEATANLGIDPPQWLKESEAMDAEFRAITLN